MTMENVPENACVGCGPANPLGLRLAFERTADGASSAFVADARWQGFPGRLHSAALYLALIETMNWSLYARTGRMGLPTRTSALTMTRRVPIGARVMLTGRVFQQDGKPRTVRVDADAMTPAGEPIGSLDREYEMVDEATFLARMGYDELPAGYEDAFAT